MISRLSQPFFEYLIMVENILFTDFMIIINYVIVMFMFENWNRTTHNYSLYYHYNDVSFFERWTYAVQRINEFFRKFMFFGSLWHKSAATFCNLNDEVCKKSNNYCSVKSTCIYATAYLILLEVQKNPHR